MHSVVVVMPNDGMFLGIWQRGRVPEPIIDLSLRAFKQAVHGNRNAIRRVDQALQLSKAAPFVRPIAWLVVHADLRLHLHNCGFGGS
jgi:hypothetical protein